MSLLDHLLGDNGHTLLHRLLRQSLARRLTTSRFAGSLFAACHNDDDDGSSCGFSIYHTRWLKKAIPGEIIVNYCKTLGPTLCGPEIQNSDHSQGFSGAVRGYLKALLGKLACQLRE